MKRRLYDYTLWNLFLLTVGAGFVTFAVQNVAAPHGFLTGGIMGVSLLCTYIFGNFMSATTWNLLFNIPLMVFSWFNVSRAFVIYTTYGTFAMSAWSVVLDGITIPIQDPLYACILSGVLYGIGCGVMLKTKGSSGGLDFIAAYVNQKWGVQFGSFSFMFNSVIFIDSAFSISPDLIIVSFIQIFIVGQVTNYVVGMFNQRKMVVIITNKGQELCREIAKYGGRTTLLPAYGGYSHEAKEIVITITAKTMIKFLEELVFRHDPHAMFTVEDTFYAVGGQYRRISK